jgi:hypothetical protein
MPGGGQSCSNCYFAANQTQQQAGQAVTVLTCRIAAPAQNFPALELATDRLLGSWPQVQTGDWCGFWNGTAVPGGRACGGCYFKNTRTQQVAGVSTVQTICQFAPPTTIVPPKELATDVLPAAWPSVDPVNDWCGEWAAAALPGIGWRLPQNVNKPITFFFDASGNANPAVLNYATYVNGLLTAQVFHTGDEYIMTATAAQVAVNTYFVMLWKYTTILQPAWNLQPANNWFLAYSATQGTGTGTGGSGDGSGGGGGGDGS